MANEVTRWRELKASLDEATEAISRQVRELEQKNQLIAQLRQELADAKRPKPLVVRYPGSTDNYDLQG